jgi:hypothetical protein
MIKDLWVAFVAAALVIACARQVSDGEVVKSLGLVLVGIVFGVSEVYYRRAVRRRR